MLALLLLILAIALWFGLRPPAAAPITARLTLALPMQLNSALAIVASGQKLYQKNGLTVTEQPFLLGKDALKSLLDGKADLAIVADTPFMYAATSGKDIAILATISQARRALALVARRDHGITQLQHLRGKAVMLTKGTNFPYFLDALLQVNQIPADTVQQVDMKTPAIVAGLSNGTLDAAVVFQPFLAQLEQQIGQNLRVFYGEDVYAFRFLLVGKPDWIAAHPAPIRALLKALNQANLSLHQHPEPARQALGQAIKVDDALMRKLFNPDDYALTLDQASLLALDDQTRWAMQRGLIPGQATPNYLKMIKHQDLEAVLPNAVTLIH
jgi:NitT/TauT family transport system substrate-binding protein